MRCFSSLVLLLCLSANLLAEAPRPNVVLIMADDQGWGDVGYHGHPELKTPQIDKLAAAGLRLEHFYTAHFNCSPTRASIMTGRHPARMGTFSPGAPIRAQELTVARTTLQLQESLMKNALTKSLDDPTLEEMPVIPTDRSQASSDEATTLLVAARPTPAAPSFVV